jgi:hypothetical protein
VLGEGRLVHRMQRPVVCSRLVAPDLEPIGRYGWPRHSVEVDRHPPEEADVLEPALLEQLAAFVVDHVGVDPGQLPLAGPTLGPVEKR